MAVAAPSIGFSPLRFALREVRGGLRGFGIFIACIALGVMTISGVGSFSQSLSDGLAREGRVILGGDVAFTLIQREANASERAFLARSGKLSVSATLRAMASGNGQRALVELKAVDGRYPLYGQVALDPDMPLSQALAQRDGAFGAAVDPTLLARLGLKPGARLSIGAATIEIAAVLRSEPDKLSSGIGFGPRVLISEPALRATGLVVPGSLVRWHYHLKLPESSEHAADAVTKAAALELPHAGWQVRTHSRASPALERNIDHFTEFLTLVGLTALLVGGVGVANAVKSHIERKREVIATLKALGAISGQVFTLYLTQVLLLSAAAAVLGVAAGAVLPFAMAAAFGGLLPLPIAPAIQPAELALGFGYGLLTALAFALWPLGRAHDVPVSALFRDAVAPAAGMPRRRYVLATAAVIALLAAAAVTLSYDRRIALIFMVAAAATFAVLELVALLVMALARRLPHMRTMALRLAVANMHRPGALTPTVVLSLGLGLALLVTVIQIDGNLQRQFEGALPERAPTFYFLDIASRDAERFDDVIRRHAPDAALERVPMLRGRIMSAGGVKAEDMKPEPDAAWVLQSDRGVTYAATVPASARVVEGEWWSADYRGPPLVSMERKTAAGLHLKVGDTMVVNVLGRNVEARIANLRAVNWENLGINFVLVFSPGTFAGAPHTDIATLTYRNSDMAEGNSGATEKEAALLKAIGDAFPGVTVIRVKDAIETVGNIVRSLVLAVRGASLIALVAAVMVLGGALAAGHRYRIYDAVVLKMLGATRGKLVAAFALEYLLLGTATALFGVAAGSLAAMYVVTRVMNLDFAWLPSTAIAASFGALAITVLLGLIGTFTALGHKPATVLRNL